MESCCFIPKVNNNNGELVESKLFKSLQHYSQLVSDNPIEQRAFTVRQYRLSKNEDFRTLTADDSTFDENGEMTFESFKKHAKLNFEVEKEKQLLSEDLGVGEQPIDGAMSAIQRFNLSNPYNDKYLATFDFNTQTKHHVNVKLVSKTAENEKDLEEKVSQLNLEKRLIYRLNQRGVNVSFLTDGRNEGRYSTENATKTADGLITLIRISKGQYEEELLAEEAGHFAVGALENSPLVGRLKDLLTPEVIKSIFKDDYNDKNFNGDEVRETAGYLVGQALINNYSGYKEGESLLKRIVTQAKSLFYKMSHNDIKAAKLEAKRIASEIAKGFISYDFQGTLENALSVKETRYSKISEAAYVNSAYNTLLDVDKKIANFKKEIEIFNKEFSKDLTPLINIIGSKVKDLNKDADTINIMTLTDVFVECLKHLKSMHEQMAFELEKLSFKEVDDFNKVMKSDGIRLFKLSMYQKYIASILQSFVNARAAILKVNDNQSYQHFDGKGSIETINLQSLLNDANDIINKEITFTEKLQKLQEDYVLEFLKNYYGKDYIQTTKAVLNVGHTSGSSIFGKNTVLTDDKSDALPLENIVKEILPNQRVSFITTWFASMSNNPDILGQVLNKISTYALGEADTKVHEIQLQLATLRERFHDIKELNVVDENGNETTIPLTTSFLYQLDEDNKFTTFLKSELNSYQWEKDYKEFREQAFQNMLTKYNMTEEQWKAVPETSRLFMWGKYYNPLRKSWHKAHSVMNKEEGKYEPRSDMYMNTEFIEVLRKNPRFASWYYDYLSLKQELDNMLPEGAAILTRAPQFSARGIERIKSFQAQHQTFGKALRSSLRTKLHSLAVDDRDKMEFGSYAEEDDESPLSKAMGDIDSRIHKLPIYGVKSLKKPETLSTDIFTATYAYANMACSYKSLNVTFDAMRNTKEVMARRKNNKTLANTTILDQFIGYGNDKRVSLWLDKTYFGIKQYPIKKLNIKWNRIASTFAGLGPKLWLWGNIHGGLVNLNTGILEIFKEGLSENFFNSHDLYLANKFYIKNAFPGLINYYRNDKVYKDKLNLFILKCDAIGENKKNQQEWDVEKRAIWEILDKTLMFPYSSGEHYMQSIPYIARAIHQKLYTKDNTETNLWDITQVYEDENGHTKLVETHDIEEYKYIQSKLKEVRDYIHNEIENTDTNDPDANHTLFEIHGKTYTYDQALEKLEDMLEENTKFYIYPDGNKEYTKYSNLIKTIKFIPSRPSEDRYVVGDGIKVKLTDEQKQLLEEHNLSYSDAGNGEYYIKKPNYMLRILTYEQENIFWNKRHFSEYKDMCREICNRLHGVYNTTDKVGFQQTLLGSMLLSMRGYALGLVQRRYHRGRWNESLGMYTEGSIHSELKALVSILQSQQKMQIFTLMFNPKNEKLKELLMERGFSEYQYANTIRASADLYVQMALLIINNLLQLAVSESDDDDNNWMLGILYYFSYRALREQSSFALFASLIGGVIGGDSGFRGDWTTTVDLLPVGASATLDLVSLLYQAIGAAVASSDNSNFYYQSDKATNTHYDYWLLDMFTPKKGDAKAFHHTLRMTPFVKSAKVFFYPWDAVKSYSYGSKVKSR